MVHIYRFQASGRMTTFHTHLLSFMGPVPSPVHISQTYALVSHHPYLFSIFPALRVPPLAILSTEFPCWATTSYFSTEKNAKLRQWLQRGRSRVKQLILTISTVVILYILRGFSPCNLQLIRTPHIWARILNYTLPGIGTCTQPASHGVVLKVASGHVTVGMGN